MSGAPTEEGDWEKIPISKSTKLSLGRVVVRGERSLFSGRLGKLLKARGRNGKIIYAMKLTSPSIRRNTAGISSCGVLEGFKSMPRGNHEVKGAEIRFKPKAIANMPLCITNTNWMLESILGVQFIEDFLKRHGINAVKDLNQDTINTLVDEFDSQHKDFLFSDAGMRLLTTNNSEDMRKRVGELRRISLKNALKEFGIKLVEEAVEKIYSRKE